MSKIPKTAKRVYKGIIFDVYQWPQKMFDGSIVTFERIIRQDTVVILATVGNKIIILKQQQPGTGWFYDLPSGRMDKPGELPKQAAIRELMEETGHKPKTIKLWRTYSPAGKVTQNVYFYIAYDCKKVGGQNLDSGERIEVLYKSFDEFLKMSDKPKSMFGPLTVDMLLARIHKENYKYLKSILFKPTGVLKKAPKLGPSHNW